MGGKRASSAGRAPATMKFLGGQNRQGIVAGFSQKSNRGQELAEFALVLTLLFLFIFGALDLSRMFFASISIANAAREGARFGGLHRDQLGTLTSGTCYPPPTNQIVEAACQEGQNSLLNPAKMSVTPSCPDAGGCAPYNRIVITVTYDFDFLIGSIINADRIDIIRVAEMMIQ